MPKSRRSEDGRRRAERFRALFYRVEAMHGSVPPDSYRELLGVNYATARAWIRGKNYPQDTQTYRNAIGAMVKLLSEGEGEGADVLTRDERQLANALTRSESCAQKSKADWRPYAVGAAGATCVIGLAVAIARFL